MSYKITKQRLILNKFEHDVSIGIHDFEKSAPQRILFTVELSLNENIDHDDITQTVDYDFLREEIKRLTTNTHYNLQETLAHDIAGVCFKHDKVTAAKISLSKPDVYPDCESVGYTVELIRE